MDLKEKTIMVTIILIIIVACIELLHLDQTYLVIGMLIEISIDIRELKYVIKKVEVMKDE